MMAYFVGVWCEESVLVMHYHYDIRRRGSMLVCGGGHFLLLLSSNPVEMERDFKCIPPSFLL